jgi:hypothetical protein
VCGGSSIAFSILNKFNVVAWEQTALALFVRAHPPVVVYELDVCDVLSLDELNLIDICLFMIVLNKSTLPPGTGGRPGCFLSK